MNITIIMRYGLEYYAELGQPQGGVKKTLLRQLSLYDDQLAESARHRIRAQIEQIGAHLRAAA